MEHACAGGHLPHVQRPGETREGDTWAHIHNVSQSRVADLGLGTCLCNLMHYDLKGLELIKHSSFCYTQYGCRYTAHRLLLLMKGSILLILILYSPSLQTPELLVSAGQARSAQEKQRDAQELEALRQKEQAEKRSRTLQRGTR